MPPEYGYRRRYGRGGQTRVRHGLPGVRGALRIRSAIDLRRGSCVYVGRRRRRRRSSRGEPYARLKVKVDPHHFERGLILALAGRDIR